MPLLIPDPVQKEETDDATNLAEVITLANALKVKLNETLDQFNLLLDSLESLNYDR